jgi:hypothetical protein
MTRFALVLALLSAPAFALADEENAPTGPLRTSPAPSAEAIAVQAWGAKNPTCAQWSDGCVVCTPEGCSTPGIACTPKEIACRKP